MYHFGQWHQKAAFRVMRKAGFPRGCHCRIGVAQIEGVQNSTDCRLLAG